MDICRYGPICIIDVEVFARLLCPSKYEFSGYLQAIVQSNMDMDMDLDIDRYPCKPREMMDII